MELIVAVQIRFSKEFATWGLRVRPLEKADDVGLVVTEFLWFEGAPFYPISALNEARVSSVWLGGESSSDEDEDNLDLIFEMGEIADRAKFYEIVLRSEVGTSYGGYVAGDDLEVTDEIVNGHRVIIASVDQFKDRYEYAPGCGQYQFAETLGSQCKPAKACRKSTKSLYRR